MQPKNSSESPTEPLVRTQARGFVPEDDGVSVVIPFFKRQQELENLLADLDAVDRVGDALLQVLVVEDGSAVNDKPGLESRFSRLQLKFIANGSNQGPGYSRNHGARESQGRYLWFLDSDARLPNRGVLRGLVRALRNAPDCLAVGGIMEDVQGVPRIMRPTTLPAMHFVYEKVPTADRYGEFVPWLSTTNFFLDRALFRLAGGFDTSIRMYEDNELCLRLRSLRKGVFYQDADTVALHSISPSGRDGGFFEYCTHRRRYMRTKLRTRHVLLKRYERWRLSVLPILEAISIVRFVGNSEKWHNSRLDLAGGTVMMKLRDVGDLLLQDLYAVLDFFVPFVAKADRRPPTEPNQA